MNFLVKNTDYNSTIELAKITGIYDKPVIFHCYWNGILNKKHLISIKSCYYYNVFKNPKNKIILWLENNTSNIFNKKIEKYADIKQFVLKNEIKDTFLQDKIIKYNITEPHFEIQEKANFYRCVLLFKYGGCWFDLDCFFLRNFAPIFSNYENEICLYRWGYQNYPNNAILISLKKYSDKLKKNIEFIITHDKGWGFQRAGLTYNLPLNFLVLPCSWFDGSWVKNPYIERENFIMFFKKQNKEYNFDNFFKFSFCYHWHNKWNEKIEINSIIYQLDKLIDKHLVNMNYNNI